MEGSGTCRPTWREELPFVPDFISAFVTFIMSQSSKWSLAYGFRVSYRVFLGFFLVFFSFFALLFDFCLIKLKKEKRMFLLSLKDCLIQLDDGHLDRNNELIIDRYVRKIKIQMYREIDRLTDKQIGRQTGRQTD